MIVLRQLTFWIAIAGLAAALTLAFRSRAQIIEPRTPPPVVPAAKPGGRGLGASGLVEAQEQNTLVGVPVAALVVEVPVRVWDRVEAGQPLLVLDGRDQEAQLLTRTAEVAVAAGEVAVAEATLQRSLDLQNRYDRLEGGSAITEQAREDARNATAVARAQLTAARARLAAGEAGVAATRLLQERLVVRAPLAGTVLQVNIRAGEAAVPGAATPPLVLGSIDVLHVRADFDEQVAPAVRSGVPAVGYIKGDTTRPLNLEFVRIEPFVVPKRSLTGNSTERVDTRVLQVIYRFPNPPDRRIYVGQQMDLFLPGETGGG